MYKCLKCGAVFEETKVKSYDSQTGWYDERCPICESEYFDEVGHCLKCDEYFPLGEMVGSICKECFDKRVTFGNALRYGKARKESVEISGFLKWCFASDEIESVLLKCLQECSHEWRQRMATEYCNDDKYDYSEFLEGCEDE